MFTLLQRHQARKHGDDTELGFTLIELLIVIVVLGVLAAVTVFALGGVTAKSAQSACNADAKTVDVALAAYNANGTTVAATLPLLVSGGYLQSLPSVNTHYAITVANSVTTPVAPVVWVAVPATGTAVQYDVTNPCGSAS
jgi:prepilin-type N-terminal cleavage/methylation domain-containing protein